MSNWSTKDIPDQRGRSAVVTGATGGIGYETALELARAGAEVILAGRDAAKGAAAETGIRAAHPAANVRFELLDLASLALVAAFAEKLGAERSGIDLLVNNAGVMALPKRQTTADGFEMQFGTNHLGHFALTGALLPLLRAGDAPRVVNVSSSAHQRGHINFADLQAERSYGAWTAYGQSKIANLLFTFELQRRSEANGWGVMSNAAHPGWARTDLIANGPAAEGGLGAMMAHAASFAAPFFSQDAAGGALPTLYAATSPDAKGGGYYGPTGMMELKGPPGAARISVKAKDETVARRLWEVSEELTGVRFEAPVAT